MALNPTGIMSIGGPSVGSSINLELGLSATANSSLNQVNFRSLAGIASGVISLSNFYGKSAVTSLFRGMFIYSTFTAVQNLVSSTGVIAGDTACNGPGRWELAGASYGGDKGIIFGGGTPAVGNAVNLISNTGVVAVATSGVGTIRVGHSGAGYGNDKAVFLNGRTTPNGAVLGPVANYVSNTGVLAADTPIAGPGRVNGAAASYGGDKAIYGYGNAPSAISNGTQLISNTGVVAAVSQNVGTSRTQLCAAPYGSNRDSAIFMFGAAPGLTSVANRVSNTGVVAADTPTVATAKRQAAACGYGGDKAIFAYGGTPGTTGGNFSNLVSNTGVVASNGATGGAGRFYPAGLSYSFTA